MKMQTQVILAIALACLATGCRTQPPPGAEHYAHTQTLHEAAASGNISEVLRYLKEGVDVDVKDREGRTPLMIVGGHHLDVAKILIENGADVNARATMDGGAPLIYAAMNGDLDLVNFLLGNHADVNAKQRDSMTPLMNAAMQGYLDVAKVLIDNGAEVNPTNRHGRTPLMYAALRGRLEMVRFLLRKGADVNARDIEIGTPLTWAARGGSVEVISPLLAAGADVNSRNDLAGRTPLMEAIRMMLHCDKTTSAAEDALKHQIEMVRLLIDKGADVNAAENSGLTPLMLAVCRSDVEAVIAALVRKGADVNVKDMNGRTPLKWASENGCKEVADYLRQHGAKE